MRSDTGRGSIMRHGIKEMMAVFMADKRRRKGLAAFATALSLLVIAGVFMELMQPVVTMTPDPICGMTEHSHSSACYERMLECALEEDETHTHSDACYKNVLVCGLSEHSHVDACYPTTVEEPTIAVQSDVTEEKQTDNAAAETADSDADTAQNAAAADATAETERQTDEEALETAPEISRLALTGSDRGYLGQRLSWEYAVSGAEAVNYVIAGADGTTVFSGAADAGTGIIFWTADSAGDFVLTLTASNADAEVSAASSFSVEEAAELGVSVSTDVRYCFAEDIVTFEIMYSGGAEPVACHITAEQGGETIAETDTYQEIFSVTTVSASKASTLRVKAELVDTLGNSAVAECEIPCAVHRDETRGQWAYSAKIDATGIWMEDLCAVARTQIGYKESDDDFIVDEDGNIQGYTRYGDWYGAKYEEWCAAFASFCLHYAGVPENEFPQNGNCEKWISSMKVRGLYADADQHEPEAGDLIFFDWENDGKADHVGIVVGVEEDAVYTIEGNHGRAVRENSYAISDSRICGYGLVSLAYTQHIEDMADEEQADSFGILWAELEALAEGEEYAEEDICAIGERADAAYEAGMLSDAEYEELTFAVETLMYSEPVTLATDDSDSEEITISFVINNSNYTYDPTGNRSHVIVNSKEGLNEVDFTYDELGTKTGYFVNGTGTLISFKIPSGESLSDNGYTTLKLTITNWNENAEYKDTYTYISAYSWLNEAGMVCNANTVFTEDTNLYLRLYANSEKYNLNFVCCEDCAKSVTYVLSENGVSYPSATVGVGESVSAEYIPTAADVNQYFSCATCTGCGRANGKVLDYWYVLNQNGEEVKFTEGTEISDIYLNASDGSAIKVYAAWKDAPDTVSVTFYDANYTKLSENSEITNFSTLADVKPESDPVLEGCGFVGWAYKDGDGTILDGSTVISTDTAFIAVYKVPVTVKMPDLENGDLDTYVETEYTVYTGQSLACAVDAEGNVITAPSFSNGYFWSNYGYSVTGEAGTFTEISSYSYYPSAVTLTVNYTKGIALIFQYSIEDGVTQTAATLYIKQAYGSTYDMTDEDGNSVSQAPALTLTGYAFNGWKDGNGNSFIMSYYSRYADDTVFTADLTKLNKVHFVCSNPEDENGQTAEMAYYVEAGEALSTAVDADGAAIGDSLPDAVSYAGYEFVGWYYAEGDSATAAKATLDMIIESETYFTANYRESVGYMLVIHDVAPDGEDYSVSGEESVDFLLAANESARTALEGYTLHDDVNAADCIWYTIDGGEKKAFNIDSVLTEDTEIYTYTYCLTLNASAETAEATEKTRLSLLDILFPAASAEVNVSVSGTTITITAREGDVISASDFVIDGVDYALYTWTYTDENGNQQTLDLKGLIGSAMTADYNQTATGTAPNNSYEMSVNYYVFLDGERKLLKTADTLVVKANSSDSSRYYVSAGMLESVYGEFGFEASSLTEGTKYFPHTNQDNNTIWANAAALDGYSPVVTTDHRASDVYYLPYQSVESSGAYTGYITSNTFYTIKVLDEDGYVIDGLNPQYGLTGSDTTVTLGNGGWKYWATESDEDSATEITVENGVYTISAAHMTQMYTFKRTETVAYRIVLKDEYNLVYTADELAEFNADHAEYSSEETAENVSVTLKSPGAYCSWTIEHYDGSEIDESEYSCETNADGTVTITFAEIARNYVISLTVDDGAYVVKYVTEEVSLEQVGGGYYPASSQGWVNGNGPSKVAGQGTPYTVAVMAGDTVLAPDTLAYTSKADYKTKGEMLFTYSFWYWEIIDQNDTVHTLDAGKELTEEMLAEYAIDGVVTLTARYSVKKNSNDDRFATCSFFVIINSSIADVGGGSTATPTGNYSDALYTTQVTGAQNDITLPGVNQLIYAKDVSTPAVKVDEDIRKLDSTGYTYEGKTVYLKNVPSDEYCLARLRTWANRSQGDPTVITLDGTAIATEDLTTENFTIRWFVFKYEGTDGWHVDGLLVPRQGKLTITKTFDGDADAIEAVKASFTVEVSKSGDSTESATVLNLDEKTDENAGGYTAYDEDTDTYTWVIDVNQTQKYLVKENNYLSTAGSTTATAEYRISNSKGATSGYAAYPTAGVEVTAYAYATDVEYTDYQTVHLRNTYIPTGTLMIRKSDATNGTAMGNVSFTLYNGEAIVSPIYKVGDNYYLYEPTDATGMTEITDGVITTNASGYLNLVYKDVAATYKLKESVPTGYEAVEDIEFTIDTSGNVTLKAGNSAATLEGSTLTVANTSQKVSITVVKEWAEGDTPVQVKVRLMYNGNLVSEVNAPEATLNARNNWIYTWENQPLYLDGKAIEYSVRETWIGDSAYSADVEGDGFEDYVVKIGSIVYTFADGTTSDTATRTNNGATEYATSASITVTNETYKGQIQFTKVDAGGKALAGAEFTLYSDETCTVEKATATSDTSGQVSFGAFPTGTYYMKETRAPEGYKANGTLYRFTVTSTVTRIEYKDADGNWQDMTSNKKIANEKIPEVDVTVIKTDEGGNALSGATFQLQTNSSGTWENKGSAQTTDANGYAKFTGLRPGTYQIVETAAPDGYYMLTGAIGFSVDDEGKVTLTSESANWSLTGPAQTGSTDGVAGISSTAGTGITAGTDGIAVIADSDGTAVTASTDGTAVTGSTDGTAVTADTAGTADTDGGYTLTVVNHSGSELPMTGGRGTILYTIGGTLLMAASLLCGLGQRRRRERRWTR